MRPAQSGGTINVPDAMRTCWSEESPRSFHFLGVRKELRRSSCSHADSYLHSRPLSLPDRRRRPPNLGAASPPPTSRFDAPSPPTVARAHDVPPSLRVMGGVAGHARWVAASSWPLRKPRQCVFTRIPHTRLGGDKNLDGRRLDVRSPSEEVPRRTNDGHDQRALHSP
jgi:hypothetical protein